MYLIVAPFVHFGEYVCVVLLLSTAGGGRGSPIAVIVVTVEGSARFLAASERVAQGSHIL